MSFGTWFKSKLGVNTELPDGTDSEPSAPSSPVLEPEPHDPILPEVWAHLDPKHIVPKAPLKVALKYLSEHMSKFPNQGYLTVVDFTLHSGKRRMYIIGLDSGNVETHCVAHGSNSDPDNDGYATKFSNTEGSHQSSLGIYKVAENHPSEKFKYALNLDGLMSLNSRARERAILMHSSAYVDDDATKQGRSWGCFAVEESKAKEILGKLKGGSLLIAWHNDHVFSE